MGKLFEADSDKGCIVRKVVEPVQKKLIVVGPVKYFPLSEPMVYRLIELSRTVCCYKAKRENNEQLREHI